MIQYQFPAAIGPLRRGRVLWLSSFALAAYPAGFFLFEASWLGLPARLPTIVGGSLMLAAFIAALGVIPTGIQRVAAGVEQGLDEYQLVARLRAQSLAYRWFSAWAFAMVAFGTVAASFGWPISTADTAFSAIVFWVLTYSTVLPAWFLVRALPDAVEGD